jgi:hypothetical protein
VTDAPASGSITARYLSDAGVTQSSNRVSAWADQSGNGYDLAQATGGNQPLLVASVINSLPVIRFDKSRPDSIFRASTPSLSQPVTVTGCFANKDAFSANMFEAHDNDQGVYYAYPGLGTFGTYAVNDAVNTLPTDGSFVTFAMIFNGTSSAIYQDNVEGATGGNANPWSWGGVHIGNYHGGGCASSMVVAELIIYSKALDSTERAQLEQYYQERYFGASPPGGSAIPNVVHHRKQQGIQ